jgi:3-hexulose-6-phosphate synthase
MIAPFSVTPQASEDFPEGHLQLALDLVSLENALTLVSQVAQAVARMEIGTPLVLSAGIVAVERVRAIVPHPITIVADVKICDAGERIARNSFAAGADVITAVAAAIDDVTWQGILNAVKQADLSEGKGAPILLDTIGRDVDIVVLNRMAAVARDAGIPVDLCVHRPKSASLSFAELLAHFVEYGRQFDRLVVAGKLSPSEVRAALEAGFDILVVGGAVADAANPAQVWNAFRNEVSAYRRP